MFGDDKTCQNNKGLIYIKRHGLSRNGRLLENEEDLCLILTKNGFIAIDPASLTLKEQLELFSCAQAVAGVHGSGFVNMLSMNPGSHIIELVGDTYRPVHDMILAEQLKIRYNEIEIKAIGNQFNSNYVCNENDVAKSIFELVSK